MNKFGISDFKISGRMTGSDLENFKCRHPFYDRESLIILGNHVTLETGTGCVHTAPGHGADDYLAGLKYNLEPYSPVGANGCFTDEVENFSGQYIFKANKNIVETLNEKGALCNADEMTHSYPHCWRCKKPVIFRATPQWFISMENNQLRENALNEIENVKWIPGWGKERIKGMVNNRPDWCVSRQRSWGIPIPVFYCDKCGELHVTRESVDKVYDLFKENGADVWFEKDAKDLLPENSSCDKCGCTDFIKDGNILDVWFDSGVSHASVLEENDILEKPADLYLEGSDQHRGWFQAALLTSVGRTKKAPFKAVLTHGFVVDAKGKKMSKSVGNVIAPQKIIDQYGAEILRLWVSASDYKDDIRISNNIIQQLSDAYRRIRNTCRYILGNLSDFNPDKDIMPLESLSDIDKFSLHKLSVLNEKIYKAYEKYEFHTIYHSLYNFCTIDLSAFYLDIIKDRLYTSPSASVERRSAQTVMYYIIDSITRMMAPVLPFTSDEIWLNMPEFKGKEESIHLAGVSKIDQSFVDNELASKWEVIKDTRAEVTKALEEARVKKMIGHPLDACVTISVKDDLYELLKVYENELRSIFIISEFKLEKNLELEGAYESPDIEGMRILVSTASGTKCERCWIYDSSVGCNSDHPNVCERCSNALKAIL